MMTRQQSRIAGEGTGYRCAGCSCLGLQRRRRDGSDAMWREVAALKTGDGRCRRASPVGGSTPWDLFHFAPES